MGELATDGDAYAIACSMRKVFLALAAREPNEPNHRVLGEMYGMFEELYDATTDLRKLITQTQFFLEVRPLLQAQNRLAVMYLLRALASINVEESEDTAEKQRADSVTINGAG